MIKSTHEIGGPVSAPLTKNSKALEVYLYVLTGVCKNHIIWLPNT